MTRMELRRTFALAICGSLLLAGCADKDKDKKDDKDAGPAAKADADKKQSKSSDSVSSKGAAMKDKDSEKAAKSAVPAVVDDGATFKGKTLAGWLALLKGGTSPLLLGQVKDDEPHRNIGLLALAQALKEKDENTRQLAVFALRSYGSDAIPILLAAIKENTKADVRWNAASMLAELWNQRGKRDSGSTPSDEAADAVPAALTELLMKDKDSMVRRDAAMALARIGEPGFVILIKAIKTGDRQTRLATVLALSPGHPPAKKMLPTLIEVLKDEDETVRCAVVRTLGSMGNDAGEALPGLLILSKSDDKDGLQAREAIKAIHKAPRATAPALIKLLKEAEPHVRLKAIEVLCEMEEGDRECLASLLELIKRRDSKVRQQAAKLLLPYGSAAKDAVVALTEIVANDSDPQTRLAAIHVLGAIGPNAKAAVGVLKLAQKDTQTQPAATAALEKIQR